MKIYNTLTKRKDPLPAPKRGKPIRFFVCGPTVYDVIHVGNARTLVFFDTFARYLRFRGIKLFYLQNITDIDDKIIARATRMGKSWRTVARTFEREFLRDAKAFRIESVDRYARATDFIPEIIRQVKRLIRKGNAYRIEGDGWYFDLASFPDYGKLARRTVLQAEDAVSRIDENGKKRNRGDFCLWKFSKPGEPSWNARFGDGRPGWHIEDTAITEHFFGAQYDVHGGGVDLMFPHHEAEIAQAESISGKAPMVKLWMHSAFFDRKGMKMSKSAGNITRARDFIAEHGANVFRLIVAIHHYRTRIEYEDELALQAARTLEHLEEFLAKLALVVKRGGKRRRQSPASLRRIARNFNAAMDDDLNTTFALAAIFSGVNEMNKKVWGLGKNDASSLAELLHELLGVFGIVINVASPPRSIQKMAGKREVFRRHQQFTHADRLRKEMERLGYRVDDTPLGPLLLKKSKM